MKIKLFAKIMSLVLVFLFVLPMFTFCGGGEETGSSDTTSKQTTQTTKNADTTSEPNSSDASSTSTSANTNGSGSTSTTGTAVDNEKPIINAADKTWQKDVEIRFVYQDAAVGGGLTKRSIIPENDTGETNRSILQRNEAVENDLGVKIVINTALSDDGMTGLVNKITPALQNKSNDFEVVVGYHHYTASLCFSAKGAYLYNLNAIPANRNYLELNKGFWGTNFINGMSYKGATWWITGDISLRYIAGFYVTFVNADIWDEHKSEFAAKAKEMFGVDYDVNKNFVYDMVENGHWNLDFFSFIVSKVYSDTGNGERDKEDIFGFVLEPNDIVDGLLIGSGIKYSRYNSDGTAYSPWQFALTGSYLNDKYLSDKMMSIQNVASTKNAGTFLAGTSDSKETMEMFAAGKAMCVVNKLYHIESYLSTVSFSFFVLPVPNWSRIPSKSNVYDTNKTYNSALHDGLSIYAIPTSVTGSKLAATTATLNFMAYYSYRYVRNAYYDSAIMLMYVNDEKSKNMIEIAHASIFYDPIMIWNGQVNECINHYRGPLTSATAKPWTTLQTQQTNWTTKLTSWLKDVETAYKNSQEYPNA